MINLETMMLCSKASKFVGLGKIIQGHLNYLIALMLNSPFALILAALVRGSCYAKFRITLTPLIHRLARKFWDFPKVLNPPKLQAPFY